MPRWRPGSEVGGAPGPAYPSARPPGEQVTERGLGLKERPPLGSLQGGRARPLCGPGSPRPAAGLGCQRIPEMMADSPLLLGSPARWAGGAGMGPPAQGLAAFIYERGLPLPGGGYPGLSGGSGASSLGHDI